MSKTQQRSWVSGAKHLWRNHLKDILAYAKWRVLHVALYALKGKVKQELERLESTGIISPVEFADWAAPIVPMVKTNGTIRICGDYKVTINQAAKVDTYPLPRIEDFLASLGWEKLFTKLDLAHAYQQIPLDGE